MNLLIYGTYSGPGTVNTGNSANNTLYGPVIYRYTKKMGDRYVI